MTADQLAAAPMATTPKPAVAHILTEHGQPLFDTSPACFWCDQPRHRQPAPGNACPVRPLRCHP